MEHRKRAKPNTPERYLWRKPGARHLWFRLAVPARFRGVELKRIIQCSLGTLDRREASLKAAKLRADLHAEWEARLCRPSTLSHGCAPTHADLQRAATGCAYSRVQPKIDALWKKQPLGDDTHANFVRSLTETRERFLATREGSTLPKWQAMANKEILKNDWALPTDSQEYDSFVQMIAESAVELLRVEIERRTGTFDAEPRSAVVRNGLAMSDSAAADGETIPQLFERYAAQRLAEKRKRPDTVNQDRKVISEFATFVGSNRSVRSITKAEVREWRNCLASLPAGFRAARAYAGLSLRSCSEKAATLSVRPMRLATVNKYVSTLSPFVAWCVTQGYAELNPCEGLFYSLPKSANPRPPFTPNQLQRIFTSPLFTGFNGDGKEHLPGRAMADDWRFWIPLAALFTGARISELAQLRVADVVTEEIPYLLIKHDEAAGQQTKSGRTRSVPLHSGLVGKGFLAFVDRQRHARHVKLFPELQPNVRGNAGASASRFWRCYLKKIGIKEDSDGFGSHSFRHTLADRLRLSGYLDDEIEVVLGHNQKTVTSGYGRIQQGTVSRLSTMIESVSFPEAAAVGRHLDSPKV